MSQNGNKSSRNMSTGGVTALIYGRGVQVCVHMGAHGPFERLTSEEARVLGERLIDLSKQAFKNASDRTLELPLDFERQARRFGTEVAHA